MRKQSVTVLPHFLYQTNLEVVTSNPCKSMTTSPDHTLEEIILPDVVD